MTAVKRALAETTNPERRAGMVADVLEGADLFVGLSGARILAGESAGGDEPRSDRVRDGQPRPRGLPRGGRRYARVVATGRSDYPNQINNVLAFPGIFRGALDVRARQITEEMKTAAARAIAAIVAPDELREDYIIPSVFNREVAPAVAAAVAEEARRSGAAGAAGDEVGYHATDEFHILPSR